MKKKNNKGFSLIELIIAIAILVILTGLLAPQFMKYIEQSREAKDIQTLDTVYSATQGALANQAAYKDLKDNMTTTYKDIEDGITVDTIIGKNGNPFADELISLLGTNDVKKFALSSKKARVATNDAVKGKIYVKVSDDLQEVTVSAREDATKDIADLTVGKK